MPERFKDKRPIAKQKKVYDFFISKGLGAKQAASLTGNFIVESGLDTTIKGDLNLDSPSQGLAQWRKSRLDTLKSKYEDPYDLDNQLDFVWWELNNTHKSALSAIKNANTLEEAALAVRSKYEVAWDGHDDRRIKNSSDVYNNFNTTKENVTPKEQEVLDALPKKDNTEVEEKKTFTPETQKAFDELKFQDDIIKGVANMLQSKQPQQKEMPKPFSQEPQQQVVEEQPISTFDNSGYNLYRPEENEFLQDFLK